MEKDFIALDVKTANPSLDSICQIGIVKFVDGQIVDSWNLIIDPEDWFDPFNVSLHGITEEMVSGKPKYPEIYNRLKEIVNGMVVVHHTAFDKIALSKINEKYSLDPLPVNAWLNTARIVRRTWEQFKDSGYGLVPVSEFLNIKLKHHDALNDAIATGQILLHAIEKTQIDVLNWLIRVNQPITVRERDYAGYKNDIKKEGNPDGDLYGEVAVFTGSFSLPKKDLSIIASQAGCAVDTSFTSKTTILVVGIQNEAALKGAKKSSKHIAAEKRIANGESVRILSEKDFREMCQSNRDI
ncbi:exonuclease domain-containing protein [Dysgonomonas macrotermitis]|uniref:DNA polymerase-3 subunit epsilon n=1 Tax=Dysgonomonas macrotermitis TaxID=1346286 RepID=A0A1M4UK21_9BACT|nr:exonuclease domain-containing protein [Dysgonomonas macrotermitis]SHE57086.1 DNA polymerase-3 subunit epsilon [Dysgonomonas macrotermitis]